MWKLIIQALRWVGTASIGWMASDVVNETNTTAQSQGKSPAVTDYVSTAGKWFTGNIKFLLILFGVALAGFWVFNKFFKKGKK